MPLGAPAEAEAAWRDARDRIDAHLGPGGGEFDAQAAFAAGPGPGWLVLDEQLQVPRDALADLTQQGTRVELLLVDTKSGQLWLCKLERATSDELDGPVLTQAARLGALPGALRGGVPVFLAHFVEVWRQKHALGLVDAAPGRLQPPRALVLALGDARAAFARIACWPEAMPAGVGVAVLEGPEPLEPHLIRAPEVIRAQALAGPRAPYAPRRPRWNAFTQAEDTRLAAWSRRAPGAPHLGEHGPAVTAWLDAHDTKSHDDRLHPRSSQAACLQVFAPVVLDLPGACAALRPVLAAAFPALKVRAIENAAFEAPHGPDCPAPDCAWRADMAALVGESGSQWTRLDVLLKVRGVWRGQPARLAIGIEYKYSESEFGTCGGFTSDAASLAARESCVGGPGRESLCHLHGLGRRYVREAGLFSAPPLGGGGPCPLLGPLNQLTRGHATTAAFAAAAGLDAGLYLVVHDPRNPTLLAPSRPVPGFAATAESPLETYRAALRPEHRDSVGLLPIARVLDAWRDAFANPRWVRTLRERYAPA